MADTVEAYTCSGESKIASVLIDGADGFTKAASTFPNLTINSENVGESFLKVSTDNP